MAGTNAFIIYFKAKKLSRSGLWNFRPIPGCNASTAPTQPLPQPPGRLRLELVETKHLNSPKEVRDVYGVDFEPSVRLYIIAEIPLNSIGINMVPLARMLVHVMDLNNGNSCNG